MGKKKAFIDKKNSSTYHLLYRSQRDVGGEGVILWPSPDNNEETNQKVLSAPSDSNVMSRWKEDMQEAGIVDDYNYEQHMKPITGTGDFVGSDGRRADALQDARAHSVGDQVQEVSRQLESIALTPDCMDDDIAQALFGDFEEGDFEELLDDFCITAAQEPDEEEEFDFDAHVQMLMAKARQKQDEGVATEQHDWGRQDQKFFAKAKPLHQVDDEDDESGHYDDYFDEDDLQSPAGVVPALSHDEERALCEKFHETLLEYDSDEVGDLEEDDDARGDRPLEGNAQVEAALNEYLEEREDEVFMAGTLLERKSGFHTLPQQDDQPQEKLEDVLQSAKDFLAQPVMDLPPEEILIDDNNPVIIDNGRRRRKKNSKTPQVVPEDESVQQIQLSNKTGLPLGVLPNRQSGEADFDFDTIASVNKGEKRNKQETPDEKKMRKALVKQERQLARMQKKMLKEAFREEFQKYETADDIAGQSVFRF